MEGVFSPSYSSNQIWYDENLDECLTTHIEDIESDVANKADANHTHAEYAGSDHTHTGYATVDHTHSGYANANHTHSDYASANHTHTGYAASNHAHSYNDLTDKPTIPTIPVSLPANGGNADTVDGKHASAFATASHTHNYAGSSSAGGAANSASKLATARTVRTNLASTSTASFDGSANITPGVTGTLPIANGGTGATTAASAVTKLGIADYVVARGTTGIWTYQKWNSGVAECWGSSTINYQISCTTQQAAGVYTDSTFRAAHASLPSGLFNKITFATSNVRSSGYSISQISGINTETLTYRMWCPYSTTLSSGAGFDFYVKGTWK